MRNAMRLTARSVPNRPNGMERYRCPSTRAQTHTADCHIHGHAPRRHSDGSAAQRPAQAKPIRSLDTPPRACTGKQRLGWNVTRFFYTGH